MIKDNGTRKKTALLVFDGVEELDMAGPLEVLASLRLDGGFQPYDVFTVATPAKPVKGANGLSINPDFTLGDCPIPDILIIPGGEGTRPCLEDETLINWIINTSGRAEYVLTVCTGSILLAATGLLDGLAATTYYMRYEELAGMSDKITVRPGQRFVDNGKIITAAGVSAGIDAAIYLVAKMHGKATAVAGVKAIEYDYYR